MQTNRPKQLTLNFGDEPLNHTSLTVPAFQRPEDSKRQYDGISPREAFFLVSELLARNMCESEIAPYLVAFIQKERYTISHLLKQIEQNGIAINSQQQENAYRAHALMEELTALETAWQLYELNISPLRKQTRPPSRDCILFIRRFRKMLGKFRRAVPELHIALTQQTPPSQAQSGDSSPPRTPREEAGQWAQ